MSSIDIYSTMAQPIPVTQSKTCTKCNIDKPLIEFTKSKITKDELQYNCKLCRKEYAQENKKHIQEHAKSYQETNKEYLKAYTKEYRRINKEKIQLDNKDYEEINKDRDRPAKAARTAKRRASKLKATPAWCELDLIKQLYIDCKLISEMTGVIHHVDHIVPLQSEIVRGLHCMANLRIITAIENKSKSNSYWPDMP